MPALTRVELVALLPTPAGCATFLGDGEKTIVFYIDPSIGISLNAAMCGEKAKRPQTHDLFMDTLKGLGATISRCIIVSMDDDIYYARLILEAVNEVLDRKIVELDARPSDCLALSVRSGAPLYVVSELWDRLEDMTLALEELRKNMPTDQAPPGKT